MLIIWHTQLDQEQEYQLTRLDLAVHYWPRSRVMRDLELEQTTDWWISFSHCRFGMIWVLRYPRYSQIVYGD